MPEHTNISDFSYSSLCPGEIRLLYPVWQENQLSWKLEHVPLELYEIESPAIKFDALSYVWGDQSETVILICNGKRLPIGKNLHSALPYLARRSATSTTWTETVRDALPFLARRQSPLPIWIDAICINQDDEEEKLSQIRQMHKIYRHASKVWVWLGLSDAQELVPNAIALLGPITRVGEKLGTPKLDAQPPTLESEGLPPSDSPVWNAIYHLLLNEWFCRLWPVQEAALAGNLGFLCGRYEIPWTTLQSAIVAMINLQFVLGSRSDGSFLAKMTLALRKYHKSYGIGTTVKDVANRLLHITLHMAKGHVCSDPRDRVYGVLGFVGEQMHEFMIPNIRQNPSPATLYVQFARFILTQASPKERKWWLWLSQAFGQKTMEGLPSWCPDLHQQHGRVSQRTYRPFIDFNTENPYQSNSKPNIVVSNGREDELIFKGQCLDSINYIHPEHPIGDSLDKSLPTALIYSLKRDISLCEWEESIADKVIGSINNPTTEYSVDSQGQAAACNRVSEDQYWRTLIGNWTNQPGISEQTIVQDFHAFRNALRLNRDLIKKYELLDRAYDCDLLEHTIVSLPKEENAALRWRATCYPAYRFNHAMNYQLRGRRLFTTTHGRFGFADERIREGDVICVFNNAPTPHVLRRAEDREGEAYRFVSEAYVHDMMYGELDVMCYEDRDITLV